VFWQKHSMMTTRFQKLKLLTMLLQVLYLMVNTVNSIAKVAMSEDCLMSYHASAINVTIMYSHPAHLQTTFRL